MKQKFANCLLLLLGHFFPQFASAAPYGSGWYRELQFNVGHEDNVSRSYKPVDVTPDNTASVSLGLGYSNKRRDDLQYTIAGYISYSRYDEYDKLTNLATSIGGNLVYQPYVAYNATWYGVSAEVTRLDYADSAAREGYLFAGSMSMHKRLGMQTIANLGFRYKDLVSGKSEADAARYAAFDFARHEVFAGFEYRLKSGAFLVAEYSFQHGGFTSSVSGTTNPAYQYDAESHDPAFETCTILLCSPFYAFRSVANIHGLDLGVAFTLGEIDYDLSARYYDGSTGNGPDYRSWIASFGAIWNF